VQSAVQNIDQFKADSQIELRFRPGQTVLSKKAKSALDDLASNVQDKKGYIIEVQGFSSGSGAASVENSQRMANSVVRYLVINHDIPVYRIYTVGMGNAPITSEDGKKKHVAGGRVEISLLKNAIGDIQVPQQPATNTSATPSTGGTTATPSQSNPPAGNNVTPSTNQAPTTNQSTPNTQSQPPQTTTEQQPK
jgi:OmpA family protein